MAREFKFVPYDGLPGRRYSLEEGDRPVAEVYFKADAHLLGAAPEMLEALEQLEEWWLAYGQIHEGTWAETQFDALRVPAIIAKAKGEIDG